MIRRDFQCRDGRPGWMLIAQVDHAQLALQLAQHWAEPIGHARRAHEDLLQAIGCHDDGWTPWEQQPRVDRCSGRPIDFTEMSLVEAIIVWRRSIAKAEQKSFLTAWLVSRHFEALLRRSRWSESDDPKTVNDARNFLDEQAANQLPWLSRWQREQPASHTLEVAEAGLFQLQLFDLLSLWFCCARQDDPLQLEMPSGAMLSLTPEAENRVRVDPWPAETDPFELSVTGRVVPQRRYTALDDLAKTPSQPSTITWTLLPRNPG